MEITPAELAVYLNGKVEGEDNIKLHGFGKLEEAGPGMLTFLSNPKYTHLVYTTKASAILVSDDFQPEVGIKATLIRVPDPYKALADLLNLAERMKPQPKGIEQPSFIAEGVKIGQNVYVGAFSYISSGVKIGENVKIYPQVYLGHGVEIGDNTVLRPGVKVYEGCKIGKDCILHSGVVIGGDGFGFAPLPDGSYEKIPQTGNVILEDNVEVGANSTVDRATFGSTVVGKGTKIDNLVQIAHNVNIGEHNIFCAQVGVAGSTKIGNFNKFAGQVGMAGHITIGDSNEIGAQSGIPNNVGSGNRLMGYPAIDARQFAKNCVYIKNLSTLYKKNN